MSIYKIVKSEVETSQDSGKYKAVWNVVDANDGYIYETFDLRRDAKAWIDKQKSL